ncbi:NAD(P)-dependent oxidoreductase [Actinoplanes sp. NPDC023714]|uniref:NAD-dependent epimerase/dehydratase family protein n=1 Tax=Actinoplanes sp. NPDC023714 TaxID=3154322 RepID=UPI0033C7F8EA
MTGAAGRIGRMLRPYLPEISPGWRLTDRERAPGVEPLDLTDAAAVARACRGVAAIVHLGGISAEASFEEVLDANVRGTEHVLRGAAEAGVPRVVIASSNHATGRHDQRSLPDDAPPRPDSFYGWSKAAVESLARLYHDEHGLDVVCLRIGHCLEKPADVRDLSVWLSPADAARLIAASLTATGYHLVWGVSANTRRWWPTTGGEAIGYHPRDDAEVFAPHLT